MEVGKEDFDVVEPETPAWAAPLFEKMKAEICAEVHAKVAYSMRIMLDQMAVDLRATLVSTLKAPTPNDDDCYCRDLKKCRSCKQKRAANRMAQYALKKEERKQSKIIYKENKKQKFDPFKSSGTEGDTEFEVSFKKGMPVKALKYVPIVTNYTPTIPNYSPAKYTPIRDSLNPPPIPPRRTSKELQLDAPTTTLNIDPVSKDIQKPNILVADSNKTLNTASPFFQGNPQQGLTESKFFKEDMYKEGADYNKLEFGHEAKAQPPSTPQSTNIMNINEAYPSPSDSEFEVVSLPSNIHTPAEVKQLVDETTPAVSDFDESSDDETEPEMCFTDCQQFSGAESVSGKGLLYPNVELKKMSLSFSMGSSTSTFMEDCMSICDDINKVEIEDVGSETSATTDKLNVSYSSIPPPVVERERAPYSASPTEVQVMNGADEVPAKALPAEFERNRAPYRQVPTNSAAAAVAAAAAKEPQSAGKEAHVAAQQQHYRVDNLPESLWDEALTVAAQTYNAARVVVENLADSFVPGGNPVASGSRVPVRPPSSCSQEPKSLTPSERVLVEMGFKNYALNSTLLARHGQDIEKVIAELVDR